jgi:cobalt/nickel transport system permease protein
MGAGHAHGAGRLYWPVPSPVHALPAHCKILAVVAFVFVAVATPREQFLAFGAYAGLLGAVAAVAHVPARVILRRMVVEVPFVAFALLLPFFALGPTVEVLGVEVAREGLLGGWNILAKGTLGVIASILLSATTELRELLRGLERLKVPSLLVQIAMFMFRYLEVVGGEMRRMKVARESRAFQARSLRQVGVLAHSAGALFIRSYERGERVHLAMLSRGYTGTMPVLTQVSASGAQWRTAAVLPLAALGVAVAAWMAA